MSKEIKYVILNSETVNPIKVNRDHLIYVASPYAQFKENKEFAVDVCCEYVYVMALAGVKCYSPLAHGYKVYEREVSGIGLGLPDKFWYNHGLRMLGCCSELHVLTIPGWRDSEGIKMEIKYAEENDIQTVYVDMAQLTVKVEGFGGYYAARPYYDIVMRYNRFMELVKLYAPKYVDGIPGTNVNVTPGTDGAIEMSAEAMARLQHKHDLNAAMAKKKLAGEPEQYVPLHSLGLNLTSNNGMMGAGSIHVPDQISEYSSAIIKAGYENGERGARKFLEDRESAINDRFNTMDGTVEGLYKHVLFIFRSMFPDKFSSMFTNEYAAAKKLDEHFDGWAGVEHYKEYPSSPVSSEIKKNKFKNFDEVLEEFSGTQQEWKSAVIVRVEALEKRVKALSDNEDYLYGKRMENDRKGRGPFAVEDLRKVVEELHKQVLYLFEDRFPKSFRKP